MPALNPLVTMVETPPIPEAHAWAARYDGAHGPALDLCQAVPGYPPHPRNPGPPRRSRLRAQQRQIRPHQRRPRAPRNLRRRPLHHLRRQHRPRPNRHNSRLQPGLLPRHADPRPRRRRRPPPAPLVLEPPADLHHAGHRAPPAALPPRRRLRPRPGRRRPPHRRPHPRHRPDHAQQPHRRRLSAGRDRRLPRPLPTPRHLAHPGRDLPRLPAGRSGHAPTTCSRTPAGTRQSSSSTASRRPTASPARAWAPSPPLPLSSCSS